VSLSEAVLRLATVDAVDPRLVGLLDAHLFVVRKTATTIYTAVGGQMYFKTRMYDVMM
jgi:hypothetical protein